MAWFTDTFLPSIFSRAGVNKSLWLSQKQTAICCKYMVEHRARDYENGWTRLYYTAEWDGRKIHMSYSKLNGCGMISFSQNDAETAEQEKINAAERETREKERAARLFRKHPEKWQARIDQIHAEIQTLDADDAEDIASGISPDEIPHAYRDELLAELKILLSAAG